MDKPRTLTENDIREELLRRANRESSHDAFARKIGISPQYLNNVVHGEARPGPAILRYLGLKKVVLFRGE